MPFEFIINFILHLDKVLPELVNQYHSAVYLLLFFIIFSETGFVVTPFLPGDSLIFAAATLAASGKLNSFILLPVLYCASILGDNTNYQIGHALSEKVTSKQKIRFVKTEYIERTHRFFEKHGGATVILAKFMPIIRTFSPFVAGVGSMTRKRFFIFDVIGGFCWVSLFFLIGFSFGQQPFVKEHFTVVVLAIVFISVMPAVIMFFKSKFAGGQKI